ncbi:MAG: hypothetical protein FK731_12395 [Asgard group archaeon]|nr:hypothetical protein [Asgard group archaeon]
MTEDIFTYNVSRIEKIYSILIKGESNPQQEVEMRIELIDSLSNIEASLISEKDHNQDFIVLLVKLRELLLNWDPYGQWFRLQKNLVDSVYEVLINAKNVVFVQEKQAASEASRLKKELDALKNELSDLRSLMSSLVKEKSKTEDESYSSISSETIEQPTDYKESIKIEESSTEQTTTLPWKEEKEDEKQESSVDPPIMTPLITTKEIPESSDSIISEPSDEELEEKILVSDSTLKKMTQSSDSKSSNVLGQMKSLIDEAERETEKQMSDFKEQYKPAIVPPIVEEQEIQSIKTEDQIVPPTIEQDQVIDNEATNDEASSDDWVKPSEILKQKEAKETTTTVDPYMQLLTLEAEKYRLEKEIEKNETEYQEGLKSKQEFDDMIIQINKELTIVREQIDELRAQLTS